MDTPDTNHRTGELLVEAVRTREQLLDRIKELERRTKELTAERDEERNLNSRLRDHSDEAHAMIEQWKYAFDMVLDDDGKWSWKPWIEERDDIMRRYLDLLKKWNRAVGDFNAKVDPRPIGRPLAASEQQIDKVRKLRKAKASLREIVKQTGLGFQTVRTIIGKDDGTDRTSAKRNEFKRIELNRARMASWRARKRSREALPKRFESFEKEAEHLRKEIRKLNS
jgi:hypothetical protein